MVELLIRQYRAHDAERVTEIIQRCLLEVNSRDYPPQIIDRLRAHYSAERVAELSGNRHVYVAETDRILGTVSRDGNKVYTMFVDPRCIGNGVGRQLMQYIEDLAAEEGHDYMETEASITAHDFYLRLGYTDLDENEGELGLTYSMRKRLR